MNDSVIIRWLFGKEAIHIRNKTDDYIGGSAEQGSGISHRPVPEEWVRTVHTMFPHLPLPAIRRDLERTRSVEITCERILRDGTLPILPSDMASSSSSTGGSGSGTTEDSHTSRNQPQGVSTSLLKRYQLTDDQVETLNDNTPLDRTWETEGTEREKRLQARKVQMVLMARKRMLTQSSTPASSSSSVSDHPMDSSGKGKERADFD
ncbi:hypothetical protein BDF22DRAFT_697203 [Syncephalis plumigaleata]|nr:hypothetical protein BDF22DRAFT_697203 [Syncephalis plumigaleata]